MEKIVSPGFLSGTLRMLPSKSASHRAVMMAAKLIAGRKTR